MTLVLASTTLAETHKGSLFVLRMQVRDEEDDPYNITGTIVSLRLAHSRTDDVGVLEVLGTHIVPADGLVEFEFTPAMTEGLSAKAYDMDILVDDWVVPNMSRRFGFHAIAPGV